jgi:DNA-binding NarL/FixJ family response regulator
VDAWPPISPQFRQSAWRNYIVLNGKRFPLSSCGRRVKDQRAVALVEEALTSSSQDLANPHRQRRDRPVVIVQILHVLPVAQARTSDRAATKNHLSPRLQQILAYLLDGKSEKEIACALGLSPHTVHVYVKTLYQRYEVNSRGELMSLWVKRDEVIETRYGPRSAFVLA